MVPLLPKLPYPRAEAVPQVTWAPEANPYTKLMCKLNLASVLLKYVHSWIFYDGLASDVNAPPIARAQTDDQFLTYVFGHCTKRSELLISLVDVNLFFGAQANEVCLRDPLLGYGMQILLVTRFEKW